MKLSITSFITIIGFSLIVASCIGDNKVLSDDPNPYSVSFKAADLAPGIESQKLTIDETNLLIYNTDSVSYTSEITKLLPVFVFKNGVNKILVNGSEWNTKDSLDFSSPLEFQFIAQNKINTSTFIFDLKKHKIDPEKITWTKTSDDFNNSVVYEEINGLWKNNKLYVFTKQNNTTELFTSIDGDSWTKEPALTTVLKTKSIILHNNVMAAIDNNNNIVSSSDGITWTTLNSSTHQMLDLLCSVNGKLWVLASDNNDETGIFSYDNVSDTFTNFEKIDNLPHQYSSKLRLYTSTGQVKILLIGGINQQQSILGSVFSTMSGDYWVQVASQNPDFNFGKRYMAGSAKIGREIFLYGGLNELNEHIDLVYKSIDEGRTWHQAPSNQQLPTPINARKQSLVISDDNQNIWIIGGKDGSNNMFHDVWKGRLNKMDFLIK